MEKEYEWLKKRVGKITASELSSITSASGKIIDGVVSYIRSKRFERRRGYALPVTSRAMEVGNDQEPYVNAWARKNLGLEEIIYSKELLEIPFWIAPDCPLGASPDAHTPDERIVLEYKTLVGNETTEFFCDIYTAYEEKKARVWKEHGDQILGLMLSKPTVEEVVLIKYAPQWDDIMEDTDSPVAEWRGLVFKFKREDYKTSLEAMRQRIILINAMIDAPINPMDFKSGKWSMVNGKLKHEE